LQNLTIQQIQSIDRAYELRPECTALWERCPKATPFQTPEWQLAWWDAFGANKNLSLLSLRDQATSRLVALFPAVIFPQQRKVMFIGTAVSDELDILAEPESAEAAAIAFLAYIQKQRPMQCEFAPLPESSPFRTGAKVLDVMPIVDLSRPLPANMRRNLRRSRRRAEKFGNLRFESASEENFDEMFAALIDLHSARWNRRNEPGVLAGDAVRKFQTQAARALFQRGISRLYALRIGGRIVAAVYALLSRGRMCSYIGGFDPELQQLSLGTLTVGYAIEEARREQFSTRLRALQALLGSRGSLRVFTQADRVADRTSLLDGAA
jgi:CelD/BcsL family acetyltransferase involved in cellulose biosynthesis